MAHHSSLRNALLFLVAAAPAAAAQAVPTDRRAPSAAAVRRAVLREKALIDSLARAGDRAAIAERVTDGAVLLLPSGDSTVGRAAVAAALAAYRPDDRITRVDLYAPNVEPCLDGAAFEFGGNVRVDFAPRTIADTATFEVGHYALRWAEAPDGRLRVSRAAFLRDDLANRQRVRCDRVPGPARFARRHFGIIVAPALQVFGHVQAGDDVQAALQRGRFRDGRIPGPNAGIFDGSDEANTTMIAGVRAHFGPAMAELTGDVTAQTQHHQGYRFEDSSHVTVDRSTRAVALTMGARWRGLRAMAGPALVRSSWFTAERSLARSVGPQGEVAYAYYGPRNDDAWRTSQVVPQGELGYTQQIVDPVFVDVRVFGRGGGSQRLRGRTPLAGTSTSAAAHGTVVSLGIAF